ncbi:MAG: peptide deformylase [Gaiellales bacterium]
MARDARTDPDEEREARRRIAQAQIRQFPDPVLRSETHPVEAFDDDLRALAQRMFELADDAVGAGLAAPQIGLLRRFAVVQLADDEGWLAMANPEITVASDETEVGGEGCLSLDVLLRQAHSVPVARSTRITVRWQDLDGAWQQRELVDMPARIVQHEVDHLDGVLTLDRAEPEARREAMRIIREESR